MPMQHSGAQAARKPPQMTDEQTRQLAAYVASLGPGPAVPDEEWLDTSKGDATKGGEIFRINCAMCHNAAGAGGALTRGKYAPPVIGVEAKHVYEAMDTGPQNMPPFNENNLSPSDKRDVITYLEELEANGSPGGMNLGSLGPVTEGLYVWTIVLSLLLGCAVWRGRRPSECEHEQHFRRQLLPRHQRGRPQGGRRLPESGPASDTPRQADLSKSAEKRAERIVAAMFLLSVVGTVVFIAAYFVVTPTGMNIFAEEGTSSALWWSNLVTGLGFAVGHVLHRCGCGPLGQDPHAR